MTLQAPILIRITWKGIYISRELEVLIFLFCLKRGLAFQDIILPLALSLTIIYSTFMDSSMIFQSNNLWQLYCISSCSILFLDSLNKL